MGAGQAAHPGANRRGPHASQLDDALVALDKPLSASDVAALESIVPADAIGGTRYPAQHMKDLDSER